MTPERLKGVLAARGGEPAGWGQQRADETAVADDRHDQKPCRQRRPATVCQRHIRCAHSWRSAPTCRRSSRPITRSRSATRSAWRAPAAAGCARNTSRQPPGSEAIRLRMSSRSRRFTRLRTTAEPTARLTTKPTFGPASLGTGPAGISSAPETTEPPARRPERNVRRNSSELLIRVCWGSTTPPAQPWLPARLARRRAGSDGELVAALATAGGQHGATGAGAHAQAEAVDLRPPTVVRLERTLAHWNSRDSMRCKGRTYRASRGQILTRPRPGSPYRRDKGQPVNGKGDRCAGQTKPGGAPRAARSPGYHQGTPRFPQRIRRRRLRLWKINVRRPTRWELATARDRGNRGTAHVHTLWTDLWTTSCGQQLT
jgi:hypothetical protein